MMAVAPGCRKALVSRVYSLSSLLHNRHLLVEFIQELLIGGCGLEPQKKKIKSGIVILQSQNNETLHMYVQGSAALTSFSVLLVSVSPPPLNVMGLGHAWMELMN